MKILSTKVEQVVEKHKTPWLSKWTLYNEMWPADKIWIPQVLSGSLIKGDIVFGEGDILLSHNIYIVEEL